MKKSALALCVMGIVSLAACTEPDDNTITFTATMTSSAEVPAVVVPSTGSGTFTGVLNTETNMFTYDLTFSGLTSNVNNGHIHGPADAGATASALVNFNTLTGATFSFGQTSGTGHGEILLNSTTAITGTINGDSLRKLLLNGKAYANIHTVNNPQGEIRGQITRK